MMPAEWDEHRAVWLALPHDQEEWGEFFRAARKAVVELATRIASDGGDTVELLVPEGEFVDIEGVRCHALAYGDIWLRDTGPVFTRRGGELRAARFDFNGWGGKYLFEGDTEVASMIAALRSVPVDHHHWTLEGGAVDVDGEGTLLTTRQCLQNPNRNPGLDEAEIDRRLARALGATQVIWLDRGLAGDHTDGHVDNIARFVAPGRVVCMRPSGQGDPNREVLAEIRDTLAAARDAAGRTLDIVELPSPGLVQGPAGAMPASYCNFLICNQLVVVPTFGVPQDQVALDTLAELFPGRQITGLDAFALLTGGGTVHCISQQEPIP